MINQNQQRNRVSEAVIATQINCTLGTLRLCLTGLIEWSEYWEIRWNWYLGELNEELEFRVKERTNALNDTLNALRVQQEQSERLLLNILPEEIANRPSREKLKNKE